MDTYEVGEKVFISEPYSRCSIGTVERKTKTMIIVNIGKFEKRFRHDGREVGGDMWHNYYLSKLTPELKDRVHVKNLISKAVDLKRRLAVPGTKEELERFIVAIDPFVNKVVDKE